MFVQIRILLFKLTVNALVVLLITLFPGIWFNSPGWVVWPAIGFVLLNTFLPLLILLLGFDLNLLTLAVFSVVMNAVTLCAFDWLMPAFHIVGLPAMLGGVAGVAAANFLINWFVYRQEIHFRQNVR